MSYDPSGRDPLDAMTEPSSPGDAAAYLIEMLASMAHFANISDLHNSSVILAAASRVVEQECRLMTDGAPRFRGDPPVIPFPFDQSERDPSG
jgi:hypothetical protein